MLVLFLLLVVVTVVMSRFIIDSSKQDEKPFSVRGHQGKKLRRMDLLLLEIWSQEGRKQWDEKVPKFGSSGGGSYHRRKISLFVKAQQPLNEDVVSFVLEEIQSRLNLIDQWLKTFQLWPSHFLPRAVNLGPHYRSVSVIRLDVMWRRLGCIFF